MVDLRSESATFRNAGTELFIRRPSRSFAGRRSDPAHPTRCAAAPPWSRLGRPVPRGCAGPRAATAVVAASPPARRLAPRLVLPIPAAPPDRDAVPARRALGGPPLPLAWSCPCRAGAYAQGVAAPSAWPRRTRRAAIGRRPLPAFARRAVSCNGDLMDRGSARACMLVRWPRGAPAGPRRTARAQRWCCRLRCATPAASYPR